MATCYGHHFTARHHKVGLVTNIHTGITLPDCIVLLFVSGTDLWQVKRTSESPFEDIPPVKMVLHYEAKACYKYVCKDLTGNDPPRDGRLTGHKIYTWDIKVIYYHLFQSDLKWW